MLLVGVPVERDNDKNTNWTSLSSEYCMYRMYISGKTDVEAREQGMILSARMIRIYLSMNTIYGVHSKLHTEIRPLSVWNSACNSVIY